MTKARILADYVAGGTTATEFDYMDGVTSNVQTQLDAKLPLAGGTMTGEVSIVKSTDGGNVELLVENSAGSGSTDETVTIKAGQAGTVGGKIVFARHGNYGSTGDKSSTMNFYTADDNVDNLRMHISKGGNVGIGTASPSKNLHVNGTTMGPVMEGEMIWSKDFTWGSNTSPSLTATGLTYGNIGSSGAIYMFHFYWANETLTDSYGYSRMYALYRNDYGALFASDIERTYGFRSGTAGFQGYPYISNPGTSNSGTTVTLPFQNTGGGNASYNAIMYVSVHKIHCDSLHETN